VGVYKVSWLARGRENIVFESRGFLAALLKDGQRLLREGHHVRSAILGLRYEPDAAREVDLRPFHAQYVALPGAGEERDKDVVTDRFVVLFRQSPEEPRQLK